MKACREMTTYLTKRGKVASLLFAVVVLAFVIPMAICSTYAITDRRDYINTYSVHIFRAASLSDAQMIKDNLALALEGIHQLGLKPSDRHRVIWFTGTENSTVQTQIMNIETVILASDEVINCMSDIQRASTTKEIGTDIYNEKLKNIQSMVSELHEGQYRIERAWQIKHKRGWLVMYWIPWLVIPFGIAGCVVFFSGDCMEYFSSYNSDEKEQFKKDNKLWIW